MALVEARPITEEQMKGSAEDFQKNILPLFEELEEWRKLSVEGREADIKSLWSGGK